MNLQFLLSQCYIFMLFFTYGVSATHNRKVTCPGEDDTVCVECSCSDNTGFNTCEPLRSCPKPVTSTSVIRKKDKQAKCPYGKVFTAQCTLCECTGEGGDHCAMCYALPVRRNGQPEELNKRLSQVTDNRFFNYEINGFSLPDPDDDDD